MWVAVLFHLTFWTQTLADRYVVAQFDTEQECREYARQKTSLGFLFDCFKKGEEPPEYHK